MKNQYLSFKIFLIIYFAVIIVGAFYFIKNRTPAANNLTQGQTSATFVPPEDPSSYVIPTSKSEDILTNLAGHLDLKNIPEFSSDRTFAPYSWDEWITLDIDGSYKFELITNPRPYGRGFCLCKP